MPICAINGSFGSGKTLLASMFARIDFEYGRKVYANYKLNFPYEHVTLDFVLSMIDDPDKIGNCIFILDEAYTWLESRVSGFDEINRTLSYFIMQSRKRDLDLYYTCQLGSMVDLRFKELAAYYIIGERLTGRNMKTNEIEFTGLKYYLIKQFKKPIIKIISASNAAQFYGLYDHKEIVDIGEKTSYRTGQTYETISALYGDFRVKPDLIKIASSVSEKQFLEYARAYAERNHPKLSVKESTLGLVFKMLKDSDLANAVLNAA